MASNDNLNGNIPFISLAHLNPRPNPQLLNLFPTTPTNHPNPNPNPNQTIDGSSSNPVEMEQPPCPYCTYEARIKGENVHDVPLMEVDHRVINAAEWTADEDWQLTLLVQMHEDTKWESIAKSMPNRRTNYELKQRWEAEIVPRYQTYHGNGFWCYRDEMRLMEAHKEVSTKWRQTGTPMPERSEVEMLNYCREVIKMNRAFFIPVDPYQVPMYPGQFPRASGSAWPGVTYRVHGSSSSSGATSRVGRYGGPAGATYRAGGSGSARTARRAGRSGSAASAHQAGGFGPSGARMN